jgi:hypothetical protein
VSKDVQDRRIKVIRELWFTDCTLTVICMRLGMHRNAVAKLAKQVGLPPRQLGQLRPRGERTWQP